LSGVPGLISAFLWFGRPHMISVTGRQIGEGIQRCPGSSYAAGAGICFQCERRRCFIDQNRSLKSQCRPAWKLD
jgi:hypothetical protein